MLAYIGFNGWTAGEGLPAHVITAAVLVGNVKDNIPYGDASAK